MAQGVLEAVPHASWETPIVTPIKPNRDVHICADYKCIINRVLQDHTFPVVGHILATLAGAKVLRKLVWDCRSPQGYQVPVSDMQSEECQEDSILRQDQ